MIKNNAHWLALYCFFISSHTLQASSVDDLYYSLAFIKNITKHHEVGALAPSSSYLATEITTLVNNAQQQTDRPLYVLEVGAGTGVFTQKLIDILEEKKFPYHLDVIEINQEYCDILKKRFQNYQSVHIYDCSILEWHPLYRYDHIVSGLPFTVMPTQIVIDIIKSYEQLIHEHSTISYFEYILTASLKSMTLFGDHKKDFDKKRTFLNNFKIKWKARTTRVFMNIPPAYVHHITIAS